MNDDRRNYMNMMDEMEQLIQAYERRYLDFYKKHHDKNEKVLYPEANGSLRITYGNVKPYMSYSGEKYPYFTTSHSMTEKYRSNPSIQEYKIPDDFLHVFTKEHFGKYAKNDTLVLCYIASNHTTGGNSGSPVLNSRGELIGINFDRSWESTMSDYYYSSDVCRNIFASTNYILFIIDKYAKCEHIMKELDIIEP